ncbi:MAG: LamG domain-containing protein, partial [Treponema sp.]|nr:LamG domain-containing protein [Treponema sp.]
RQVMDCAGTNSPDEPYDLCWVPNFNGPVMTELTATVWVNPDNIAGIRGVLTFEKPTNDNAGLYIFNYYGGYLYLTYNENENTNLDLDNDFTDYRNQWLLLALIFKGDTATLYVNGIKTGEIQGTIPCAVWWNADGSLDGTWGAAKDVQMKPPTIDSFWIGGQQSTQHFIGMMSDVRLYDKALNAVQIQALIDEAPQAIKDQLATE